MEGEPNMVMNATSNWTGRDVLRWTLRELRRQPIMLFVALGLVPTLWGLPLEIARRRYIPATSPTELGVAYFVEQLYWITWCAWSAIPLGGTVLIALDVVRGVQTSMKRFLDGLRAFTSLFVTLFLLFGFLLVGATIPLGREPSAIFVWGQFAYSALGLFSMVRCFCAIPLVVDRNLAPIDALYTSWRITKGAYWRVLRVCFVVFAVTLVGLFLGKDSLLLNEIATFVTSLILTLAFVRAYEWIQASDSAYDPF